MTQLFLIAQIAGRTVAIDSADIVSVVDIGVVVPVPRAASGVSGLTALRSRVVTVIDTRILLGDPDGTIKGGRAVVGKVEGHHYAWLVDAVEDVVAFDVGPVASGLALDGAWLSAARGIVERDGAPILVIDLRALLPAVAVAA